MLTKQRLLMKEYKTAGNNVQFDLKFKDRLTLVRGDSGIGKSMLFNLLERDAAVSALNIVCLDWNDISNNAVENILSTAKNKVIFIDNADAIIDLGQRIDISFDRGNQYVIFTHSTEGYKPSKNSFTELVINKGIGKLKYLLH